MVRRNFPFTFTFVVSKHRQDLVDRVHECSLAVYKLWMCGSLEVHI